MMRILRCWVQYLFLNFQWIDLATFSDLLEGRKLYNTSSSDDLMVNEEMVEYSSDNNGM